jgi:hypothetical protein
MEQLANEEINFDDAFRQAFPAQMAATDRKNKQY